MSRGAEAALATAGRFVADGAARSVERLPGGNINDTWLVRAAPADFILQRINHEVFRDPDRVVHNMRVVTRELVGRCAADDRLSRWRFPEVIPTPGGEDVVRDQDGDWWRAITYLDGTFSVERPSGVDQAGEAGVALGVFHRLIAGIPPESLHDTLPGFHVTPRYVADFERILDTEAGRARVDASPKAREAVGFIRDRSSRAGVLKDAAAAGTLAVRPIHGDPKIANLLFDRATGGCVSVIDFDTVKPGLIHYDIGDCVRSCCNPAGENPARAEDAALDPPLVSALLAGYLREAEISSAERALIPEAVWLLTFELAVRFLADHLDGDRYFRIATPGLNLHRARTQIALCRSVEAQRDALAAMAR
jgi:Ser/Thr protein kinase RdoA (MazF antagonist)